jgi:hypothetical protein
VLGHDLGVHEGWLRLFDQDGQLIPTGDELDRMAQQRAKRRKEVARRREELARLKADEIRKVNQVPDMRNCN